MIQLKTIFVIVGFALFIHEGWSISGNEFKEHFDSYERVEHGTGDAADYLTTLMLYGYVSGMSDLLSHPFEDEICLPFWRLNGYNMPVISDFVHAKDNEKTVHNLLPYDIISIALSKKFPCGES